MGGFLPKGGGFGLTSGAEAADNGAGRRLFLKAETDGFGGGIEGGSEGGSEGAVVGGGLGGGAEGLLELSGSDS